ncbi:MAG TPA: tRNA (adenosine(37)-N6)-dimethylallyltransferase MiaA [Propionibacterium sp.]|nr:tRNA (adenosine(37)-N6)-dimethylallyltransferase MiaA [Propionibacterium sp.]
MLPILVLNGPTASGKSSLAVEVAVTLMGRGHPAEVVNTDSMLVYRGMDIGTAKPTSAERRGVPHHLVDIMDVTQTASVADFQVLARATIEACRARGVLPIVVGGSALYMRAILDHFEFPGTDAAVRARWEAELDRVGSEAMHAVLAERAPATAAEILPGNGRRIVRALEVLELTGGHTPNLPAWTYALEGVVAVGLELDRAVMDRRIAERVDQMWADGLVEEVRALERAGLREGVTASRAIGYRQVLQFLDGELSEEEAREAIVRATRRFARKQLGWFRRDARVTWYPAGQPGLAETLADDLVGRR